MSCERQLSLLVQEGEETLKTIPINQNNKYLKNAKSIYLFSNERKKRPSVAIIAHNLLIPWLIELRCYQKRF